MGLSFLALSLSKFQFSPEEKFFGFWGGWVSGGLAWGGWVHQIPPTPVDKHISGPPRVVHCTRAAAPGGAMEALSGLSTAVFRALSVLLCPWHCSSDCSRTRFASG